MGAKNTVGAGAAVAGSGAGLIAEKAAVATIVTQAGVATTAATVSSVGLALTGAGALVIVGAGGYGIYKWLTK